MKSSPKKLYFVSLGCPKNQVDTEVMLGAVRQDGHSIVSEPEAADVLVVNTCGFIEAAKEESIATILELGELKAADANKKLVVTGCLSQRYPTELAAELPEVDHFLGSADMLALTGILGGPAPRGGVTQLDKRAYIYDHTTPRQLIGARHSAYVKIAEGCDRPCGFCIIPQLRGPQRSRSIGSIVAEVRDLVKNGTREICLVAQDSTNYGRDLDASASLETLLDGLCELDDLRWVRIHYAYPSAVSPGLIERIAQRDKVATYLDVPIQHIDSEVLKRMRRGYGEGRVRELIEGLRDPGLAGDRHIWLRTTLLVGHPGETDEAFSRLYDFVAEGHIDHLGVFPWSREDGTSSALLPTRIPANVAQDRAAALLELQSGIVARRHAAMIGQTFQVMVDGISTESDLLLDGRHEGQAPGIDGRVVLTDGTAQPGAMVTATITQADAHDFVASLDPAQASASLAQQYWDG